MSHGTRQHLCGRTSGFTLVEVLVMLVIMAAAGTLVAPYIGRERRALGLHEIGLLIATDLRSARTRAIVQRTSTALALSIEGQDLQLDDRHVRLPVGTRATFVTAAEERIAAAIGRIRFFPDGSSTGGKITLETTGRNLSLTVDWLTGNVRVTDERS